MKRALPLLVAALISACASSGVKISDAQLGALKKGSTTADEVVSIFGSPTTRTKLADGALVLQYVYAQAQIRASTFIPVVGMFTGGSDIRSNITILKFDLSGKLAEITTTESQMGTGNGLYSGQTSSLETNQPRQ